MRHFLSTLLVVLVSASTFAGDLKFQKHTVNANADYSAAALIDVNSDGKLDIVAGGDWYEAPNWKRHKAADVPRIGGRPDGFSHLPFDVNRDGRKDIITVNYRSRSIKWMECPTDPSEAWQLHVVTEPGPMETGRLVDVDGDGNLDLLPNGRDFAAWWEFRWKSTTRPSEPAWIRHELPAEAKGHGQGFGDIDGDGLSDIVGQNGWLKAPEDARSGKWLWHPDFKIERGSIPMLVADPDKDGDNDIVWCSAHGFGVYWLEQTESASGKRIWKRHAIDTSWSQCHAPLWADLDGDGQGELIAGKRYMAHGGSDPGAYDPLVVYRYQYDPETKKWNRWTISSGDRVGMGLDPKVGDIDNDGDLDILACGRSGLYWLENKGPGTTHPKPLAKQPGKVDTPEKWGHRRTQILDSITSRFGNLPGRRVPLDISVSEEIITAKFTAKTIEYSIDSERRVSAQIFVPNDSQTGELPGVVCMLESESKSSKAARRLAEQGCVSIVPSLIPPEGEQNKLMDFVWQSMRAADVLQATKEVHAEQLGYVGNAAVSGATGYQLGFYVSALDQRFVVTAVGSVGVMGYKEPDRLVELISASAPRALSITMPLRPETAAALKDLVDAS